MPQFLRDAAYCVSTASNCKTVGASTRIQKNPCNPCSFREIRLMFFRSVPQISPNPFLSKLV